MKDNIAVSILDAKDNEDFINKLSTVSYTHLTLPTIA